MLVTWDSSAQQLQNYHFIVIKCRRVLAGKLYSGILARSCHVTTEFRPQTTRCCSASRNRQCLRWVFHLTTQKEGETREAEIYCIFFEVFFFFFLLRVSYSLRPGHAIVQNLLFEAVAEK